MHAAGGMLSSVRDLSRWLLVNLSDGVLDGRRVFPREAMREVHAPQIGLDRRFGRLRRFAYGLGWYFGEDDGEIVVHHFGGYSGAQAHVSFIPDRGIGVAVVSNTDSRLPHLIVELIYDTLRGRPTRRSSSARKSRSSGRVRRVSRSGFVRKRRSSSVRFRKRRRARRPPMPGTTRTKIWGRFESGRKAAGSWRPWVTSMRSSPPRAAMRSSCNGSRTTVPR